MDETEWAFPEVPEMGRWLWFLYMFFKDSDRLIEYIKSQQEHHKNYF